MLRGRDLLCLNKGQTRWQKAPSLHCLLHLQTEKIKMMPHHGVIGQANVKQVFKDERVVYIC